MQGRQPLGCRSGPVRGLHIELRTVGHVLFGFPIYESLTRALETRTGIPRGRFAVERFPNQELHVSLDTPVAGSDCVVLGSIAPPDEHLLATFLLSHTLKKDGARTVTALLPYLGYARHDKQEPRKSLAASWVGEVARASGVDHVITIDVHSSAAVRLFPISVQSLSPAGICAAELARLAPDDLTVVAPDAGARDRSEAVRQAAGIARPIAWLTKERSPAGVAHSALHGAVGQRAVIVDDILDTGGTLISASEALQRAGVREILIMVTHGLYTGTAWERLWSLGVTRIYCTDTVPLPARLTQAPITVLSVVDLLFGHLFGLVRSAAALPPTSP